MTDLTSSVGNGGANRIDDTKMVQRLLNDFRGRAGLPLLVADGFVGPKTLEAIVAYQKARDIRDRNGEFDGRIDPGGRTIRSLMSELLAEISAGVIPFKLRTPPTSGPDPEVIAEFQQAIWDSLKK